MAPHSPISLSLKIAVKIISVDSRLSSLEPIYTRRSCARRPHAHRHATHTLAALSPFSRICSSLSLLRYILRIRPPRHTPAVFFQCGPGVPRTNTHVCVYVRARAFHRKLHAACIIARASAFVKRGCAPRDTAKDAFCVRSASCCCRCCGTHVLPDARSQLICMDEEAEVLYCEG